MSTLADMKAAVRAATDDLQTAQNEIDTARRAAVDAVKAETDARIDRIKDPRIPVPAAVGADLTAAMTALDAVEAKYGLG